MSFNVFVAFVIGSLISYMATENRPKCTRKLRQIRKEPSFLSNSEPAPAPALKTTPDIFTFSQSIFSNKNDISLREIKGKYKDIRNKSYNFGNYYNPPDIRLQMNKSNKGFIASLELILQNTKIPKTDPTGPKTDPTDPTDPKTDPKTYMYSYLFNVLKKAAESTKFKDFFSYKMDVKQFMETFLKIFKLCDLKGIVIFNIEKNISKTGYYLDPLTENTPHIFNIDGKVVLGLGKLPEDIIDKIETHYNKIEHAPVAVEINCLTDAQLYTEEVRQALLISKIEQDIEHDMNIEKLNMYLKQLKEFPDKMANTTELQNTLTSLIQKLK